jgi:hypothetical protein
MSTYQFIEENKTRIQSMDGNLDTATITILTLGGKLVFYWFEDGILSYSRAKV